jgi:diaminohydroxyphosphoribosylaminopyrimidine deaminase / 5-amino-6-(5-phosphoribosylamino)uracil reductase
MSDSVDVRFMRLALREARKGLGRTSPNPCVGAVIVKDGQVIGKGYHHKAGTPHAEINALGAARQSVRGATMYVTLEPCNHTGRTPPCTKAIVESGLARVVVGLRDPNPLVNGTGMAFLVARGVEVVSGVLEEECREVNHFFIKHIGTGLPWVILKAGVSLDGRLNYQRGQSGWITGSQAVAKAHRLRDQVDAILVGSGTVKIDNPSLTTRLANGRGRDAIRVVIDSNLSTAISSRVYDLHSQAPTWIFCCESVSAERRMVFESKKIRVIPVSGGRTGVCLKEVVTRLGQEGVCSLLVEGGARIHGAFLKERLADFAHLLYAPIFAGDGGVPLVESFTARDRHSAPRVSGFRLCRLGEDFLVSGKLLYPE